MSKATKNFLILAGLAAAGMIAFFTYQYFYNQKLQKNYREECERAGGTWVIDNIWMVGRCSIQLDAWPCPPEWEICPS